MGILTAPCTVQVVTAVTLTGIAGANYSDAFCRQRVLPQGRGSLTNGPLTPIKRKD